ncbi:hypothetical protein LR032_04745 [Candidatus Bipolaricaulota bacterium]|nr:hypothetical protein [Candidatus Bipolaricaulota bacterium]
MRYPPKLYRDFVREKGEIKVQGGTVTCPKQAHNPVLRKVQWQHLPQQLDGLVGASLALRFLSEQRGNFYIDVTVIPVRKSVIIFQPGFIHIHKSGPAQSPPRSLLSKTVSGAK